MTTRELLFSAWNWEPSVVAGCALLLLAYFGWIRPLRFKAALLFSGGVLLLLLDLVSPLDVLGEQYLFSAHMLEHMLLILAVPPLLLLGIPRDAAERALRWQPAAALEKLLGNGLVAWPLAMGVMVLWHLPAAYDAALRHETVHVAQHLSFLATASVFWCPVLGPVREHRMPVAGLVPYLFGACMVSTVLGAVIAFAPAGLYSPYLSGADPLGALSLLRRGWGLSPRFDQQLGGLLMWVPGCSVYLLAMLSGLLRWFSAPEPAGAPESAALVRS